MRAYIFHFTGRDNTKVSVTIDLIHRPISYTREQATMDAITAVIAQNGDDWIFDYEVQEVK